MKKSGILHPGLSKLIAETGHTDYVVVTDAGLPLPEEVNTRIDLALKEGSLPFLEVLDTVIDELAVEKIMIAEEIKTASPNMHDEIINRFSNAEIEYIPHIEFKERTKQARGLVRSGEFTSYANVILVGGVVY
ncbi:D-ribose pyranase [Alkalihalophilus lindianensis]|uniref:D-ribose pyranase n=1 Tax=Alkalihalophilus lindianensis TaxID=1630542 RepID=A0ABU3X982_9BACI|nr:D-ribose pyranase [Alkalihalophilus lindianensis]MDV2684440.1 D-ribose pyranase [Alkalihalophilus lindianensis]